MNDDAELFGSPDQTALQRHLLGVRAEAQTEGLVFQGRQMLRFDAETLDEAAATALLGRYRRIGLVGARAPLLALATRFDPERTTVVTGRLVVAAANDAFEACAATVAARQERGPVPRLAVIDATTPAEQVLAIQQGLESVHLAPLPGAYLRDRGHDRALTLAAIDDDGHVLGSSTVHDTAAGGPAHRGHLFSCALWIAPTHHNAHLGAWLYAASVLAARDAFDGVTLRSTVVESNVAVLRMLARCHIYPDPEQTYVGLALPAETPVPA